MGKMKKKRSLEEVYNATLEIKYAEGPVPVDEIDNEVKMASSQVNKGVGRSQKSEARVDTGTCNMCSAPCSSCFHSNQAINRSNSGDFSGETYRDNVYSSSVNLAPNLKSRKCETAGQHSASEASIVLTLNSSHDSFTENAESKFTLRNVELSSKLSSGVSTTENQEKSKLHKLESDSLENNLKDFGDFEGHDDNISCISGAGVTTVSSADSRTVENKRLSTYDASTNSLVSKDYVKAVSSEDAQCLQNLNVEGSKFFTKSESNDIATQEVRPPVSYPDHLHDLRLLGNTLLEDIDAAADSDMKISVGFYTKPEMEKCVKLEADDVAIAAGLETEALSSLQRTPEVEKVKELLVLPVSKEISRQSLPTEALNSTEHEPDIFEHDQVCDTCGDIGREYLLVVCCRCSDGAEHTYCMSKMLDKIPEGGWMCQECKIEERKSQENDNCDEVGGVTHRFSVRVNAKISHRRDKSGGRDTYSETNKTNKVSSCVKVPRKRSEYNAKVSSSGIEQALEPTVRSPKNYSLDRVGLHRRSSSFGNIDRGDSKPVRKPYSVGYSFADTKGTGAPTLGARPLKPRGTLSMSSSFSTAHTEPKPNLVDKVFRKQKSMQNSALPRGKEGSSRVMGKSLSSNSFDSNRLRYDESKGDCKKQLQCFSSTIGNYAEQKSVQAKMKDRLLSSSCTTYKPISKVDNKDGKLCAQGSTNLAEKVKGSSISCPRQCSTAETKSDSCQKCGDLKLLAPDALAARNSNEVKDKCNKLKAEVEAAQSKKTGSYSNDKVLNLSTSNISDDKVLKEGLATVWNLNANSKKPTATSVEAVNSRIVDSLPKLPNDRSSNLMDLPNQAFKETYSHSTNTAFPDYEYIWQGCFEVHKSGKLPDIYDGFQAHLSTCASPRVIQTMNNFPHKVVLNEVPRLSTWPIQFVETGVRETHIGLYIFARDYESYVKCYKNMVERLMKDDLALKGNIDGAEILVFPSNQLPEKSQCWNMMFFLWGVFKEKRVDCQQQRNGPWFKVSNPQDIPKAIMSSPESILSIVPIDKEELVSHMDVVSDALANLPCLLTAGTNCGTDSLPASQKFTCSNLTVEQPEYKLEGNLLSSIPKCLSQSCPEVRSTPGGKTVGIAKSLFPVDPLAGKNVNVGDTSILSNGEELHQERVPNLELALGTEVIPTKESRQDQTVVREATEAEEDVPAALSLSLSFPFTDEDHCTTSLVDGAAPICRATC
ncbi:hypothetical protein AgCh_005788 [Apium graveolens]